MINLIISNYNLSFEDLLPKKQIPHRFPKGQVGGGSRCRGDGKKDFPQRFDMKAELFGAIWMMVISNKFAFMRGKGC